MIPYEPPAKDLTPGDFRNGMKRDGFMEVQTDSLHSFGTSYARSAEAYFGGITRGMARLVTNASSRPFASRAIGNSQTLDELVTVADYSKRAAIANEELVINVTFGCVALGNGAAWMAEQYGVTDWGSGLTTSNVRSAFDPPADAKLDAETRRQELLTNATTTASLPRVHPSDVKFYNQSGLVAGKDYIIDGGAGPMPPAPGSGNANDPTTSGQPKTDDGKDKKPNEFYQPTEEDDYEQGHYYQQPQPEIEVDDDTTVLAPGAPGEQPVSDSTVTA